MFIVQSTCKKGTKYFLEAGESEVTVYYLDFSEGNFLVIHAT